LILRRRLIVRHAEAQIAEKHELHSLKENAGRIPIIIGLQRCEMFMLDLKPNGARPAIAQPGLFRISERANETI